VAGCCEHGNELPGSVKGREFLSGETISFLRGTLFNEVRK